MESNPILDSTGGGVVAFDWKKIAKSARADHRFVANGLKDLMVLMGKLNVVIHKQHREITDLKMEQVKLEGILWRFQYSNNIEDVKLKKLSIGKKGDVDSDEITVAELSEILGFNKNSIYEMVKRGRSVLEIVAKSQHRDKMYLIRKHADFFDRRIGKENVRRQRVTF